MNYYFPNRNKCREHQKQASKGCDKEKTKQNDEAWKKNATNKMQECLHTINGVNYTTKKEFIFVLTYEKWIWVVKPYQVWKFIA